MRTMAYFIVFTEKVDEALGRWLDFFHNPIFLNIENDKIRRSFILFFPILYPLFLLSYVLSWGVIIPITLVWLAIKYIIRKWKTNEIY